MQWFDTTQNTKSLPASQRHDIDWVRAMPFLVIHLSCIAVIWVGFSLPALMICIISYLVRMFAITGFYHRYFSHRTFKTSRLLQCIFAFIGGTAVQRGAIWWASHHRSHHKLSDKPGDAHSPHTNSFLTSHMTWFLQKGHFATDPRNVQDLTHFPELRFLDRFDMLAPLLYAIGLYGVGKYLSSIGVNCTGSQALVWGFCISTVFLYHFTFSINSLAHLFGKKTYPTKDNSRNNWWLALFTLGEGWHNNHHFWPTTVRQGFKPFEIDITFYLLWLMSKFHLIHNLRLPPKELLDGTLSTQRQMDLADRRL